MQTLAACSLLEPASIIGGLGYSFDELPKHVVEAARQLHQGEHRKAIETLDLARTATAPDLALDSIIAATAHCRQGNFKDALKVAERGLQKIGKNTHLLNCLGIALAGLNEHSNAQQVFLHAIQADARNTHAFLNLAHVFLSQNHPDAAFETLQQGLRQNPGSNELEKLLLQIHPAWVQALVAGKLKLRTLAPSDEAFVMRCFSDQLFMTSYHRFATRSQSRPQVQSNLQQNPRLAVLKRKSVNWLVELAEPAAAPGQVNSGYCPVGLVTLAEIHLWARRAEFLIGFPDKEHRGSGTPLAATLLLMDHAFNRIGFNKLTSIVYGDNPYSQRNTLALGFTQEGFRRDHLRDLNTGHWLSIHDNGMLQKDFRANTRLKRLSKRLLGFDVTQARADATVFA